jgi:2-polyprenyl-3-methyl-5-hydroxy-6-metoxy-1,4-benzoquinol methylase
MTPAIRADYADTYDPDTDFDRHYTLATAQRIRAHVAAGARVLELGCATGLMTAAIADGSVAVLGVDRSGDYLRRARARGLPRAEFLQGDLEALPDLGADFDHVLATNVLHELADPVAFLRCCRERLAPAGLLHVTLQNPRSIHRLCALELGMIDSLSAISNRGAQWGTRSLWTAEELAELAWRAGLATVAREGIMLKPLPNALMADLPEQVIEGFVRAAAHLPEHCAMTYLVLRRG